MKRAALLLLTAGCFNFDADFDTYCQRTGRCDAGTSAGGGTGGSAGAGASGGGDVSTGGGSGGGSATGGGSGGGSAGGTGGASTDGGCTSPSQCTSPLNGSATCEQGACSFTCNMNFHRCGFSCASNFAANTCGSSCTPCMAPLGGSQSYCDAGISCDFNCQAGFTKLNGRCAAPPNITFPNIGDLADPKTFLEARLDPSAPGALWAIDFSGQLVVSNDNGQSFTPVCRIPGRGLDPSWTGFNDRAEMRLHVSPASDRTAYVTAGPYFQMRIWRGDSDAGVFCRELFFTNQYSGTSHVGAAMSVAPDGTLYLFVADALGGHIRRSTDRGATWPYAIDGGFPGNFAAGYVAAGPGSDLLVSLYQGAGQGLWLATDAGTQVSRVSATIYASDMAPRWDPAHPGYAYAGRGNSTLEGFYSTNGGRNWLQSAAHAAQGDWAVDPVVGSGYRFVTYDAGINLERAADMRTPTWSRVAYWPGVGGPGASSYERVDAYADRVVAVVGHRLYVSVNGGASFNAASPAPAAVTGASWLDSDGTRVLLAEAHGNLYESTDFGRTYVLKQQTGLWGTSNQVLELKLAPGAGTNALVRALGFTNGSFGLVTHDAFNTMTPVSLAVSPYYAALAWAQTGGAQAFFFGPNGYCSQSNNGGDTWSSFTLTPALSPFSTTWNASVMADPTWALAAECASGTPRMYRINNVLKTATDIGATVSTQLGNDTPCATEVYSAGSANRTRVISRTGWLATSDDDGLTFTAVTGAQGGLTDCGQRRITSLPADRSVVVSWCNTSLAVSRNGGVSWTNISAGQNWAQYGCQVTSVYPLASQLLVGCSNNRPPILVDY